MLVLEINRVLQLLRIARPPLAVANVPSIRQCRCTAFTEPAQPLFVGAQPDSSGSSKGFQGNTVFEVTVNQLLQESTFTSRLTVGSRLMLKGGPAALGRIASQNRRNQ